MGRRKKGAPPDYKWHKASGQAYVQFGKDKVYLGIHGSPESRRRYQEILRQWEAEHQLSKAAAPKQKAPAVTLESLVVAFLRHALVHYRRDDGSVTEQVGAYRRYLGAKSLVEGKPPVGLLHLQANVPPAEYRASHLRALRETWVARGWARETINAAIGKMKHFFRWCHAEDDQVVPAEVLSSLDALADLQKGRTTAPDHPPVPEAPEASVMAVLEVLPLRAKAMLGVQWWTGCRPGEVCRLRGREIRQDGTALWGRHVLRVGAAGSWVWQPAQHKNVRRGKFLAYVLGPHARKVLTPWLRANPEEYLFQPREAVAEDMAQRRAKMTSRHRPRISGRRHPHPPGDHYSTQSWDELIAKACALAGVEPFTPGQVRHSFVTRVEREFGIMDAARAVGHASPDTSLQYLHRDLTRAAEIAEQTG